MDNILGETNESVELTGSDDNLQAAIALVEQGHRTLNICSRGLDPGVYDDTEFVDAVRAMVLRSRHVKVRLLITELGQVARAGHQLLNLAAQVSSFVQVRTPAEQHRDFNQAFLIVDDLGVIYRKLADRFDGSVNFFDPTHANELMRTFDSMWDHADTDPNTVRLGI